MKSPFLCSCQHPGIFMRCREIIFPLFFFDVLSPFLLGNFLLFCKPIAVFTVSQGHPTVFDFMGEQISERSVAGSSWIESSSSASWIVSYLIHSSSGTSWAVSSGVACSSYVTSISNPLFGWLAILKTTVSTNEHVFCCLQFNINLSMRSICSKHL